MATISITFSQFRPNINQVHTGIIATGGHVSVSATICPSSVLKMCQVPTRCTLVDFWIRINQSGVDASTFQIGTSQTPSGIMSLTTLSSTYSTSLSGQRIVPTPYGINNQGYLTAPGGTTGVANGTTDLMPVQISISDDATPSNIWVHGTLGGNGVSASGFITFLLLYTCDGLTGRTVIR